MNLVQQALAANDLGRAHRLLNRQRPPPGQADLRGWEWRYLWSQTRADDHQVLFAGTNRILSPLSFSGDGRLLAWEAEDHIVVKDLISRRTALERTNSWRPTFAHQGNLLAFMVAASPTNEAITLMDLVTKQERQIQTSGNSTLWMGFSPDDRRLLTVSVRPGAKLSEDWPCQLTAWEVSSARILWQRPLSRRNTYHGRAYAFSPDGTLFAAAGSGGRFQVLDAADGKERISVKATAENVTALTFSPDGNAILSGAAFADSAIQNWDARSGENLGTLEGHRSWVGELVFASDGTRLVSASADQTIRLWDWPTRRASGVLRGHLDEVDGVALAPDGRTLASRCKDGSIYLWDVTKPSRDMGYRVLPSRLLTSIARFTPDSQFILGLEPNNGVALWNAFTLMETNRLWGDSTNRTGIAFSPDARRVIHGGPDGRIRVWDAGSGVETTNFVAAPDTVALRLTDDGEFLVSVTSQRSATNLTLQIWHADTGNPQGSLSVKADEVERIFTPSLPNSLVIATPEAFRFFDVSRPNDAPSEIMIRQGELYDLAVSPDGRIAAAAYGSGFVRLWDLKTLQPVDAFKGFFLAAFSVAFSPDGKRLAAGGIGQEAVKLWDSETRQELLTLAGEGSVFRLVRFSPDGRFLLAINVPGLAHLWSAPSWEEIAAAETNDPAAPGYGAQGKAESKRP